MNGHIRETEYAASRRRSGLYPTLGENAGSSFDHVADRARNLPGQPLLLAPGAWNLLMRIRRSEDLRELRGLTTVADAGR